MYSRSLAVSVLLLAAVAFGGCRHQREVNPPPMHPVQGKVTSASGRIPAGCQIQFMPDDVRCTAEAVIGQDGSFALQTRYEGVVCEGAAEGTYTVTIIPPLSGPSTGVAAPISLPGTITIKPGENSITIPLP